MTWLGELDKALRRRGVPTRERERLVSELSDQVACDPAGAAQLGSPDELASRYAEELAAEGARRGAWVAFWAPALTASALVLSQLIAGRTGYPGFDNGRSLLLSVPAILGMFVAPQLALVAGSLAALRAWRRRGELTPLEGLERGVAELIFAAAGLAVLRRVLGGIGGVGAAATSDAG